MCDFSNLLAARRELGTCQKEISNLKRQIELIESSLAASKELYHQEMIGKNQQIKALELSQRELVFLTERIRELEQSSELEAKSPTLPIVIGSNPRTETQTPSPDYVAGLMPTYNIPDLIEHLEYREMIHESYIGLLEKEPGKWEAFGDADFHDWAKEGYSNAIYYLRRLEGG